MAADVKEKRTRLQNALSAGENGQRDRLLLAGIFLMGSALRLYRLDAQSFWYDETTQVLISIRGFFGAIGAVVHGAENCPPLSHALFSLWLRFGDSDYWVRLLPALAGMLTVYTVYLLAARLAARRVAITAAFLLAISPLHLWCCQEAPRYSFLTLFSSASMLCFLSVISSGRWLNRFFYVSSTVFALYTHPYAAFTVAAQFLYVLVYHRESVATLRGGSWRSSNVAMPSRITGASRTFVSRPIA